MSRQATFNAKHEDNRRMKSSKAKNGARTRTSPGKGSLRVFCPNNLCPPEYFAGRQIHPIPVGEGQRVAMCRNGHRIELRHTQRTGM